MILGGVLSITVTVAVQALLALLTSVTVSVTVCGVPIWLQLKVLGDTVMLCKPQAAVLPLSTLAGKMVAEFPTSTAFAGLHKAAGPAQQGATVTSAVALYGQAVAGLVENP